jgi:hypothetical protein
MRKIIQILLVVAFIAWLYAWLGAFGFSFSSRLFQQPISRLFSLLLEMLSIAVPPLSGYWVVTRTLGQKVSAMRAFVVNLVISGLPLLLSWAVYSIWLAIARNAGRLAFEADTAMGIGIVYLFCLLVFLVENILVVCFLVVWTLHVKNKREKIKENTVETYSAK